MCWARATLAVPPARLHAAGRPDRPPHGASWAHAGGDADPAAILSGRHNGSRRRHDLADPSWAHARRGLDPEVPVLSVVELGIVRDVGLMQTGQRDRVRSRRHTQGVLQSRSSSATSSTRWRAMGWPDARMRTVYAPAWTTDWIGEEARRKLEAYGIALHRRMRRDDAERRETRVARGRLVPLRRRVAPVACPYCGSHATTTRSEFRVDGVQSADVLRALPPAVRTVQGDLRTRNSMATHSAPACRARAIVAPTATPRAHGFPGARLAADRLYVLVSRALDEVEEATNRNKATVPREHQVLYQFSARGHEIVAGDPRVAASIIRTMRRGAYYRSRPLLLTLGLSIEDALASPLGRSGGFSDGRDIGVVCNLPKRRGAIVLPMSGDVGSQYTPIAGWAQSVQYHRDVLGDASRRREHRRRTGR